MNPLIVLSLKCEHLPVRCYSKYGRAWRKVNIDSVIHKININIRLVMNSITFIRNESKE